MGRTALEMTPDELRKYNPYRQDLNTEQNDLIWKQGWEIARQAASLLYEQFHAKRVVVFGPLILMDVFNRWSEIEIAAWKIPSEKFYKAVAAVTEISPDFNINLVSAEDCSKSLLLWIESEGVAFLEGSKDNLTR